MATLTTNTPRDQEVGDRNEFPVIASDIVYEGAAAGIVHASGHLRPITSADQFVGFVEEKADNSSGAAAAINARVIKAGKVELSVTGAVITDVGQPVYAQDDNAFSFIPTDGVFIGYMRRYVSAGVAIVEFNAGVLKDPYAGLVCETIAANKTLDIQDTGKAFFCTTDAVVFTLPATANAIRCKIVNVGAYGTVGLAVSPNANDKIMGPDIAGADDKDLLLTKATSRRGDGVELAWGHADGAIIKNLVGTWTTET